MYETLYDLLLGLNSAKCSKKPLDLYVYKEMRCRDLFILLYLQIDCSLYFAADFKMLRNL